MRVVCISDTHGLHDELHAATRIPDGDVLIHAGDFTDTGDRDEVLAFNAFLGTLPHRYKIVIAGNHESTFDRAFYPHNWQQYGHRQQYDPDEVRALLTNALYLEDEAVRIQEFIFYGSPWQPEFCNWAFNLPRDGEALRSHWRRIPSHVDVLVTHSPPLGHGDLVAGHLRVGCAALREQVLTRVQPLVHVFGHVHEGYGRSVEGDTSFLNASACTQDYEAVNPALVFELKRPRVCPEEMEMGGPLQMDVNGGDGAMEMERPRRCGCRADVARYDVMMHERLRLCAQKPAFVPVVASEMVSSSSCSPPGPPPPGSLRAFRVEGTTAALLFDSTLRLRPVVGDHTRATRYLFRQVNAAQARALQLSHGGEMMTETEEAVRGEEEEEQETGEEGEEGEGEDDGRAVRRGSLTRRATVAVLSVGKQREQQHAEDHSTLSWMTSANAKTPSSSVVANGERGDGRGGDKGSATRRGRRQKSLVRRQGVAMLSTMMEDVEYKGEPAPPLSGSDVAMKKSDVEATATATATVTATAAVAAVECVLCKYKVAGHIHPGVTPDAVASDDQDDPKEEEEDQEEKTEDTASGQHSRNDKPSKRLSSWF